MKKLLSWAVSIIMLSALMLNSFALSAEKQNNGYRHYDNLNSNQKAFYDLLTDDPFQEYYIIELPQPLQYDAYYSDAPDEAYNDATDIVYPGLFSFAYDNPQFFWFEKCSYSFSNYVSTPNPDGRTYHIVIKAIRANIIYRNMFSSAAEAKTKTADMMTSVNKIAIAGDTLYERVKSIHDIVVNTAVYDTELKGVFDHVTMGVFLEPHKAVCEAYAAAFKLLCDRENIPCVMVIGALYTGRHAWNYVQMEDGKWYAVDCTRDDNGDNIFYDYLLTGADGQNVHFGNDTTRFSDSNIPDGGHWSTDRFTFKYPALNATPYFDIILSANSNSSVSADRRKIIIPANSNIYDQAEAPGNHIMVAMESNTGSKITLLDMKDYSEKYFTVIMRGDVVADAVVDSLDYEKVKETSVMQSGSLSQGTVQHEAGDLNSDGVIDAFDTALLDLQMNVK